MGVIIYIFNLNISPKMPYGVLKCDVVTESHAYDFVIRKGVICAGPCIYLRYVITISGNLLILGFSFSSLKILLTYIVSNEKCDDIFIFVPL